jgi:hypothetical protein
MTDQTTSAGATPVVPDATSGQSAPAQSSPVDATSTDEQLGEGGKGALQAERKAAREALKRAEAAERELEALRTANQSDQEKAIAAARKEGAAEAQTRADAKVRRSEVRRVLATAGCIDVDIAATAGDFSELAVTDDGDVEGLEKAVTAFRTAHPALFATKRPTGSADAGSVTGGGAPASFTPAQIKAMTPEEYARNREAIFEAMAAGRIANRKGTTA